MTKPICVVQAPFCTRSGYGDMARDIIWQLIDLDLFDLKLISTPWGATPMNALDATSMRDTQIIQKMVAPPINLPRKPEVFIQITVPNEFQPVGQYNIGITAGIETTMCSHPWIEGCNRMDLILAISNHSVNVIKNTLIQQKDNNQVIINELKLRKPIEVLHNSVHTDIFKPIPSNEILQSVDDGLLPIKEKFCFLFVGHWLKGGIGEDRKNVGLLIKTFCETFSPMISSKRPALILKTSGADFSILDREDILNKIRGIKNSIGPNCPNVYLLHGDMTREELNHLYNHPKIKVHITFTKGEGFGRPLLEATMSEKPVLASGWSGHLDFLNTEYALLLGGDIKQVERGAVWDNVIIPESGWFNVDTTFASKAMLNVYKFYDKYLPNCAKLAEDNRTKFAYPVITNKLKDILERNLPKFNIPETPTEVPLVLPTLKKLT